jgi:hypothetical protein
MIEVQGNIWDYYEDGFPICITTNGNVSAYGYNIMGKGIALEAKKRFPKLPKLIGDWIKLNGNKVSYFPVYNVFSFPTKHNWWEKSDLDLIVESSARLVWLLNNSHKNMKKVFLVRPGCANGKLEWSDVKLVLEQDFDNRYIVVNK